MTRIALVSILLAFAACGDDNEEADILGVGAECSGAADECDLDNDQVCLTNFAGGYCGIADCTGDIDCPEASACIAHGDDTNYCFRTCVDKLDCNENRSVDFESNCVSSVDFVDGTMGRKACVPPSSGT